MTTTHPVQTLTAGDDWEITGTLFDVANAPLNLNGVVIEWGLLDESRTVVINGAEAAITVIDAALGKFSIRVPKSVTGRLPGGHYTDALRITAGDLTATMWVGPITVNETPFHPLVFGSIQAHEPADAINLAGGLS